MLYLFVIHTSKEFGTYHEAEIMSVLPQISIYPLIRSQKEIAKSNKNHALISMVESDSLGTLHLQLFHQKVSPGCVHSCKLPPTSGSARVHSLYDYTRSNCGRDGISQLYIVMTHQERQMMVIAINLLPAPSCLPDAIHCVCKTGCNTRRCGCCKFELECSLSWGGCKGLHCLNIILPEVGKCYRYWYYNHIETIPFLHKVKVNSSV